MNRFNVGCVLFTNIKNKVMDSKERKNESVNADLIADSMKADAKNRRRESTSKVNRLWMWLGVLVLIAILLYWLFSIGLFESANGMINGN